MADPNVLNEEDVDPGNELRPNYFNYPFLRPNAPIRCLRDTHKNPEGSEADVRVFNDDSSLLTTIRTSEAQGRYQLNLLIHPDPQASYIEMCLRLKPSGYFAGDGEEQKVIADRDHATRMSIWWAAWNGKESILTPD